MKRKQDYYIWLRSVEVKWFVSPSQAAAIGLNVLLSMRPEIIQDSPALQSRSSFIRFLMGERAMICQHPVQLKENPWWFKGDPETSQQVQSQIWLHYLSTLSHWLDGKIPQFHYLPHVLHWTLVACLPWDFCCFLRRLSCIKGNVAQNLGERCRSHRTSRWWSIWSAWISDFVKEHYTIQVLPKAYWGGRLISKTSWSVEHPPRRLG